MSLEEERVNMIFKIAIRVFVIMAVVIMLGISFVIWIMKQ
jgi:cell division septal protein FtsQ